MSSDSESDEDFVPGEPEQVSEEDSADEETDLQFEKELEHKTKKRKATAITKGRKKKRTRNGGKEREMKPEDEEVQPPEEPVDPEAEKKREDDLWAMFLDGTDTKPKPAPKVETKTNDQPHTNKEISKDKSLPTNNKNSVEDNKERERRIFEFAGETIVVEDNVIKEKIKTSESPATVTKEGGPSKTRVAGVAGILGQINKKNQLSTLEKSKLDWMTYKKEEGIEEEIQSHNKGKAGYLDRKDFLERADVRQYEIERDLRMNRRSNR